MVSKSKKLSGIAVIVPMYNEGRGARKCVTQVMKVINKLPTKSILIVVNDGSKDSTSEAINDLKKRYKKNYYLVEYKKNKGYGGASKMGTKEAYRRKFKYVIFFDSDLTNHPNHIQKFAKLYDKDWDFIKGSRYIKGGKMIGVPIKRSVFSNTGSLVARILYGMGIRDCTNGLRMVKTKLLNKIPLKENGFPIIAEELYYLKKLGARGTEIPNIVSSRKNTRSSFAYTPTQLWNYLKYALRAVMV